MKNKIITNKSKVTAVFESLCSENGFVFVITDPDTGHFIDYNKVKHEFGYGTIDINKSEHIKIADNKELSSILMEKTGVSIPQEIIIKDVEKYSENDLCKIITNFSKQVGFPLISKPLRGRQGNNLIKIESDDAAARICKVIIDSGDDVTIQEYQNYEEIRVVLLDGEVIQAYKRFRAQITGNGKDSIFNLIGDKNASFEDNNRNTIINIDDSQIQMIISDLGYSNNSVLEKGKCLPLSFGRNLSKGGECEFIEDKIKPGFSKILAEMALVTNLRLVGFDLFIKKEIDNIENKTDLVFIEYNASPDMENNFYYSSNYHERFMKYYKKIFHAIIA